MKGKYFVQCCTSLHVVARSINSGWSNGDEISTGPHFNFSVTFKNLLRLAEDFKKSCVKM